MNDRMIVLALSNLRGLGPIRFHSLLDEFGSLQDVWAARPEQWQRVPGIGSSLAERMNQTRRHFNPKVCQQQLVKHRLNAVVWGEPEYPDFLQQGLGRKTPLALFFRGQLPKHRGVAIVGTRNPSHKGREQAAWFGRVFAQAGIPVISGLAHGIDTCSHQGALAGQGSTSAVLGTPLNTVYPRENIPLADRMIEKGCVMTEYPLDSPVHPGCFPWRNRIIVGLSSGVVVIEAGTPSGALNTATWAADLNVDVFTVPGNIDDPRRKGNHQLLKEGAILAESPAEVLEQLGIALQKPLTQPPTDIATMLAAGMTPSQIVQRTGRPADEVLREVTRLQLQ